MKRFIIGLILFIFILLSAGFVFAKLGELGPDTNYFNTHIRLKLARYPLLRQVLALHFDGDARSDFLGSRYNKIVLEIDAMQGEQLDYALFDRFASKIQEITGKQVSYYVSDSDIPLAETDDKQIADIVTKHRNTATDSQSARLYVLLADRVKDQPKQIGSTYQEYGIVLFEGALDDFVSGAPITRDNYAFSTLLHEFGHQIGLEHNDQPGCLMSARAETDDVAKYNADEVVVDFCPLEQAEIAQQRLQNQ